VIVDASHRRGAAEWLVLACGVWQVGLGLYFIFLRPALLPEDVRYMGLVPPLLAAVEPGLARWLPKVFTVMGGFMAGNGVLMAYLAWRVMPARLPGAVVVAALSGALTLVVMSAVNFALHSDFRYVLLVPVVLWAAGVALALRARS
jgi:hypothetical protein